MSRFNVIPAQAGTHDNPTWVPACAGMTLLMDDARTT